LLLTTKESYDGIIKVLAEAQERNKDVMHKLEDSDRKVVLLEASIKRFSLFCHKYL
jgi:myosin V